MEPRFIAEYQLGGGMLAANLGYRFRPATRAFGNVVIDGAGWTQATVPSGSATAKLTIANLTLRHGQQIGTGGCVKVANAATAIRFSFCLMRIPTPILITFFSKRYYFKNI